MKKYFLIPMLSFVFVLLLTGCLGSKTYYEFGKPTTSSSTKYKEVIEKNGSNVFIRLKDEKYSVCIYIDEKLECFENNNYEKEKEHITKVLGEENCVFYDDEISCIISDKFGCYANKLGEVTCSDNENNHTCYAYDTNATPCS